MNINDLIGYYIKLRDEKKAMQDRHKIELAPTNKLMEEVESVLLQHFASSGANSVNTDAGTAYKSLRESFTVEDPILFRTWVRETGELEFFEARASKEAVKQYLESTGELPPGLKYNAEQVVGFRRA